MKRKLSLLAAVMLVFGLTACGNSESVAVKETTEAVTTDISQEKETVNDAEAVHGLMGSGLLVMYQRTRSESG